MLVKTQRGSIAVLVATVVAVAAILGSRLSYVPMWDGFIYASAVNNAVQWPPTLGSLRLAGHASHAYAALAIAAQALAPGSFWPMLLLGAALVAAAAAALHRLARLTFPSAHGVDHALLTAAFALQPSLLASAVQPGLDLAVVPAFLWCVVLLLERRTLWLIVVGIALAFTKETGVLLYAVLLAIYGLWTLVRTPGSARDRVFSVLALAPLTIPGLVFAAYLLIRRQLIPPSEAVVWNAGTAMIGQSLVRQLLVPRIDRYLASYLTIMSILNFAWITTLIVAVAIVAALRRTGVHRLLGEVVRFGSTTAGFGTVMAFASAFALTRFASYANSRYLLPVIALSLVPLFAALQALRLGAPVRRSILTTMCLLLAASNLRTIDPVSQAVLGTFPFGDHEMLRMTSITHECCGSGRDQLVYSPEFTNLERLMSDALESIVPGDSVLIVLPDSMSWFAISLLDRSTNRRTFDGRRAIVPAVAEADSAYMFMSRYRQAHYLALPNGSPDRGLTLLARDFVIGPERRFSRHGYVLATYPLVPRQP